MDIHLILNNLRSVYNTGALFRTADAAGVTHVHLIGTTPTPIDRFGRYRTDLHKTALGAEHTVPWSYYSDLESCIEHLKKIGVYIIALEQSPHSIPYHSVLPTCPIALMVGNEPNGLDQNDLDLSDLIIEIPQYGAKESLNVSIAGGIALFELIKNRRP